MGENFVPTIKKLSVATITMQLLKKGLRNSSMQGVKPLNRPTKNIVGLSKLARVVEAFSKRLQTQEKLTMQIAKTIMDTLDARGVAVTIDATHQCMTMRGVRKAKASTVTNHYLGLLKEDLSYQNRYLRFISNK